jgi:hypothetical protein
LINPFVCKISRCFVFSIASTTGNNLIHNIMAHSNVKIDLAQCYLKVAHACSKPKLSVSSQKMQTMIASWKWKQIQPVHLMMIQWWNMFTKNVTLVPKSEGSRLLILKLITVTKPNPAPPTYQPHNLHPQGLALLLYFHYLISPLMWFPHQNSVYILLAHSSYMPNPMWPWRLHLWNTTRWLE